MKISEVLLKAADSLSGRWVPRVPSEMDGELCAVWAIARLDERFQAHHFAARSIGLRDDQRIVTRLCDWNDSQTSEADVQHALRYAALEAYSEGL